MPWVLAAAAVGVGGTLLASNNASDAASTAAAAQTAASQATINENAREFNTVEDNTAPQRAVSTASLGALGSAFGLPGYGAAPSMTAAPSVAVPGASATPGLMTAAPAGATATAGAPAGGMIDGQPASVWDAYLQANPDVAAWAAAGHGDPNAGPNQTPEQAAAYHYENGGHAEGRALPAAPTMTGSTSADPNAYVAPAGYTDPTMPNGYNVGPRPTMTSIPANYTPGALDVSLGAYQQSPGYAFQLQQGENALDHTASSMGGVMSGARVKAALGFSQGLANADYTDWRNYTTGQYNTSNVLGDTLAQQNIGQTNIDNSVSNGLYQDDRTAATNAYNSRTGQLMTLAGFGTPANSTDASAATSFAASDAAARGNAATATGNAAIGGANAFTAGVNNLTTTGGYLAGQYMTNPSSYYGVNPSTTYGANVPLGAYDGYAG